MSEKKRKRANDAVRQLHTKKAALEASAETITISLLEGEKQWMPVLTSTPGLSLLHRASFRPYKRTHSTARDLLLHSQAHPKLDYTAHEENSNGSDGHLKDYIGVYDPRSGKLELMPARKMVVRSTLKSARSARSNDSEDNEEPII
ncbi:MAG: hypothetical protein Q9164_002591, partial [Protoblastenia rupestris]